MTDPHCILNYASTIKCPRRVGRPNWTSSFFHHCSPSSRAISPNKKRKVLDNFSRRLQASGLTGCDLAIEFLYTKFTKNLAAHTIKNAGGTVLSFLRFLHDNNTSIFSLTRRQIGAFVEYEQDRGLKALSVIGHLIHVYAFINYLVEQRVLSQTIMERKIRLQKPEALPKAIPSEDIGLLLDAIDSVRNRALLLLLLRTGMRIGELLEVRVQDIILQERKILLYIGEKNLIGRAIYFSEDAEHALRHWLRNRKSEKEYLFYGTTREQLCYAAAWKVMKHTVERAGLSHKKYSLHHLRHTFATDMLNSSMRIEVLQQILGHQSIEQTMRYAKLSDKTREEEYFRAMNIIERGGSHEPYRISNALQKVFEEKKLLKSHKKKLSK